MGVGGYRPWTGGGGTYLGQAEGVLTMDGEGVPTLDRGRGTYLGWGRGYLPWMGEGVPTLDVPTLSWMEIPTLGCPFPLSLCPDLAGGRGTYLGRGEGYLPWTRGTYLGQGGVPTLGHPLPLGVDRQTPVKTLPSRHTTYAGGKQLQKEIFETSDVKSCSHSQSTVKH